MSKIYISLPISGRKLKDVKKQAAKAEKFLQSKGYKTVSPIEVSPNPQATYAEHMGRDIQALLECDGIYMCEGWETSKGCRAEHSVAMIYGRNIMYFSNQREEQRRRSAFEVESEIKNLQAQMQSAILRRDYNMVNVCTQKIEKLQTELSEINNVKKYVDDMKNMEPGLLGWACKTLNLSLINSELSVYYMEMYLAYFNDIKLKPNSEWIKRLDNLRTALQHYSSYTRYFFQGDNAQKSNEEMSRLMDLILDNFFTEREKVFYKKYEEMT